MTTDVERKEVLASGKKKNAFNGTSKDEYATSTAANETFKLGAGDDVIYFDAKKGFGTDTVTLTKKEALDLDIKNATDISYEIKGKDVVVNAKADVSYVLEATATGTISSYYKGDDTLPEAAHKATFDGERRTFTLAVYGLSADILANDDYHSPEQDSLIGKVLWRSDFVYADEHYGEGEDHYGLIPVNFDHSDCSKDTTTYDGVTYSDIKIYKVVNGERIDITEEYQTVIKGATTYDYSYNESLYNSQVDKTSSIIIKDFASKDSGAALTINGKDVFAEDVVFGVEAKKNAFTGTRLNEAATSTSANETFKLGAGNDTITFDAAAGFGKDTVTLTNKENLDLDIQNADKISYAVSGKNVVVTAENTTENKTSSIIIKDFASKDSGAKLTVNGEDVFAEDVVFGVEAKKNVFTGTRLNEDATSTSANETFKLGAGNDTITFDAKTGFGKDTVTLTKGENLTLDINAAKDVTYAIKGNDVVVTAESVSYVLEATANGKITDIKSGKVVKGTHGATFKNEKVSFTLSEYQNVDATAPEKDFYNGKYLWTSNFKYADKNYSDKYGACNVYLDNSDCSNGTTTLDGVTYSNIKIYEVINGVKTDITDKYISTINEDYTQNADLFTSQYSGGTITLKDAAKSLANVTILNGDDEKTLSKELFNIDLSKKSSYTGTALNEKIDATEYGGGKKGAGVTVSTGAGFGEVYGSDYKDTVTVNGTSEKDYEFVATGKGNDKITVTGGVAEIYTGEGNNTVTVKGGEASIVAASIVKSDDGLFDVVEGTGNNTFIVSGGKATITTGNDVNTVTVKGGEAIVKSGNADDVFTVSKGTATINSGAGDDKITVSGGTATINAGAGDDTITIKGGTQKVTIDAYDGDDTIVGANKSKKLELNITGGKTINGEESALSYERDGKDLIIKRVVNSQDYNTIREDAYDESCDSLNDLYVDENGKLTTTPSESAEKVTDGNLYLVYGDEEDYYSATIPEGLTEDDYEVVDAIYATAGNDKIYLKDGDFTTDVFGATYSYTTVKDYFTKPSNNVYVNGGKISEETIKVAGATLNYADKFSYEYTGTEGNDKVTFGSGNDYVVETAGVNTVKLGDGNNVFEISNATATVDRGVSTVTAGKGDDEFYFGTGKYTANITAGGGKDTFDFTSGTFYDAWDGEVINEGNKVNIKDFAKDDTLVVSDYQAGFMQDFALNPFNETDPSFNIYYNVTVDKKGKVTADYSNVTMSLDSIETFTETEGKYGNFKTGINLVGGKNSNVLTMGNIVDEDGNAITFDAGRLATITGQVAAWLKENKYSSVEAALKAGKTDVLACFQSVPTHSITTTEADVPRDEDGELIYDENGKQTPVEITVGTEGTDVYNINSLVKDSYVTVTDNGGNDIYNYNLESHVDGTRVEITDTKGNDIYNIDSLDGDVVITDSNGKDTININADAEDVTVYFQVFDDFGDYSFNDSEVDIFVNGKDGKVALLQDSVDSSSKTIKAGDDFSYELTYDKLDNVAAAVANWLRATNTYTDTAQVFEDGIDSDISQLMAVYQTGSYTDGSYTPPEYPII